MAVESDSDRAGMVADWDTATKGVNTFNGIFEHSFLELNSIAGEHPTFLAETSELSTYSVAVGDTITINGTSYTVRVLQPDGTGFTLIILEEV